MYFDSCLLKHRTLHYSPVKASKIVNACTILHNMCIENNEVLPRENLIAENNIDFGVFEPILNEGNEMANDDLTAGRRIQQRLINNF